MIPPEYMALILLSPLFIAWGVLLYVTRGHYRKGGCEE